MRKINIEIHPYATKGLAPRNYISNQFRRIREDKIDKLNWRCEACGANPERIELHESAMIRNKTYVFKGFILLCQTCHDMVHCVGVASNRFGVTMNEVDYIWKHRYDIKERTKFKTKTAFARHLNAAFARVFDFTMASKVRCDYSAAKKYGVNPKWLKNGFDNHYNHFSCRIRYMIDYLGWVSIREKYGRKMDQGFFDQYDNQKIVKARIALLQDEYVRHKDFYDGNRKILFTASHPKREKIILDYAETMRLQSTASKYKPKTQSK